MSQLVSEKLIELDLSKGFSFHAVIRVLEQKHKGQKVIYQVAHLFTSIKLTIGLNNEDELYIWLTDRNKRNLTSNPLPKAEFFDRFVLLSCEVIPIMKYRYLLVQRVNNEYEVKKPVVGDLNFNAGASYSIGANTQGSENAAFELGELLIYQSIQTDDEKAQLYNYVKEKWGL